MRFRTRIQWFVLTALPINSNLVTTRPATTGIFFRFPILAMMTLKWLEVFFFQNTPFIIFFYFSKLENFLISRQKKPNN